MKLLYNADEKKWIYISIFVCLIWLIIIPGKVLDVDLFDITIILTLVILFSYDIHLIFNITKSGSLSNTKFMLYLSGLSTFILYIINIIVSSVLTLISISTSPTNGILSLTNLIILSLFILLLILSRIKRENLQVPSTTLIFVTIFVYFILIIISYSFACMSSNYELSIHSDPNEPFLAGSEKPIGVDISCTSFLSSFIYPGVVISNDPLSGISIKNERISASHTQLILNISDGTDGGNLVLHLYPKLSLFNKTLNTSSDYNLTIPRPVSLVTNKTSPRAAGSVIEWIVNTKFSSKHNKTSLLYRFKQNGAVKKTSSEPTWIWSTNQSDIGINTIEVDVIDTKCNSWVKSNISSYNITTNKPPRIVKFGREGDSFCFEVVATKDSNNDSLSYRFDISDDNITYKPSKPWGSDNHWVPDDSVSAERHHLKVYVKDKFHNISAFTVVPEPEEQNYEPSGSENSTHPKGNQTAPKDNQAANLTANIAVHPKDNQAANRQMYHGSDKLAAFNNTKNSVLTKPMI